MVSYSLYFFLYSDMVIPPDGTHNLLRPEAMEALYYMWYHTGDPKYRKWAAEMFHALKKYSKTVYGYTAIKDVRNPVQKMNSQESFWLAETMKYFYLIFSPRSRLDLSEFVITTEAHPLRYPLRQEDQAAKGSGSSGVEQQQEPPRKSSSEGKSLLQVASSVILPHPAPPRPNQGGPPEPALLKQVPRPAR